MALGVMEYELTADQVRNIMRKKPDKQRLVIDTMKRFLDEGTLSGVSAEDLGTIESEFFPPPAPVVPPPTLGQKITGMFPESVTEAFKEPSAPGWPPPAPQLPQGMAEDVKTLITSLPTLRTTTPAQQAANEQAVAWEQSPVAPPVLPRILPPQVPVDEPPGMLGRTMERIIQGQRDAAIGQKEVARPVLDRVMGPDPVVGPIPERPEQKPEFRAETEVRPPPLLPRLREALSLTGLTATTDEARQQQAAEATLELAAQDYKTAKIAEIQQHYQPQIMALAEQGDEQGANRLGLEMTGATSAIEKESPRDFVHRTTRNREDFLERVLSPERIAVGATGLASSMIGIVPWLDSLVGIKTPEGQISQEMVDALQARLSHYRLGDPGFIDALAEGIGSMLPLMVTGAGVVGASTRLLSMSPRLALWTGALSQSVIEAGSEASSTYQKMREKGIDEQTAVGTTNRVFAKNMILLPITNKLGMFAETGSFVRRALTSAAMEGPVEEGLQYLIQQREQGEPFDRNAFLTSIGVGSILGAGMGPVMGTVPHRQRPPSTVTGEAVPSQLLGVQPPLMMLGQPPVTTPPPETPPGIPPTIPPEPTATPPKRRYLVTSDDGRVGTIIVGREGQASFFEVTNPKSRQRYTTLPPDVIMPSDAFNEVFPARESGIQPEVLQENRFRFLADEKIPAQRLARTRFAPPTPPPVMPGAPPGPVPEFPVMEGPLYPPAQQPYTSRREEPFPGLDVPTAQELAPPDAPVEEQPAAINVVGGESLSPLQREQLEQAIAQASRGSEPEALPMTPEVPAGLPEPTPELSVAPEPVAAPTYQVNEPVVFQQATGTPITGRIGMVLGNLVRVDLDNPTATGDASVMLQQGDQALTRRTEQPPIAEPLAAEVPQEAPVTPEPEAAVPEPTPEPEQVPATEVVFRTAQGSVYRVTEDGNTIRDKAARPEHPGDFGIQPESDLTVYVDASALRQLGEFQVQGQPGRIIALLTPGGGQNRIGVKYTDGKDAGKFETRTVTTYETEPRPGLYPVELFNGGSRVHFGNEITAVSTEATAAVPTIPTTEAALPETPPPAGTSEPVTPAPVEPEVLPVTPLGPVGYERTEDQQWYARNPSGYKPIKGRPVKIPGFEHLDLLVHRDIAQTNLWRVTEGISGMTLSQGQPRIQKDAIDSATKNLQLAGPERVNQLIEKSVQGIGPSPRYRLRGAPADVAIPAETPTAPVVESAVALEPTPDPAAPPPQPTFADQLAGLDDAAKDALLDEAEGKPPELSPVATGNPILDTVLPEAYKGMDEAFKAVAELFGLKTGGLKSFPGIEINQETYQKALPHFISMAKHFQASGRTLVDFLKESYNTFGTGIRPYLKQFMTDIQEGRVDVTPESTQPPTDAERVGAGRAEPLAGAPAEDIPSPETAGPAGVVGEASSTADEGLSHRSGTERGDVPPASVEPDAGRVDVPAGRDTRQRRARTRKPASAHHDADRGNYRINPATDVVKGSEREKFNRNITAIQTLVAIEREGREASPEEQRILVQYSGWGGLSNAFNSYDRRWAESYQILKSMMDDGLITKAEYDGMHNSTTNAHYTSPDVIDAMWQAVQRMGFKGGRVLEPSMGIGHFFGLRPEGLPLKLAGVEMDSLSGRLSKQLYQSAHVNVNPFQEVTFADNFFDLVIGNVPFGKSTPYDPKYNPKQRLSIHNYFINKALGVTRPGGMVVLITSRYTMDAQASRMREAWAGQADLVGAIRLPSMTFEEIAGTSVTSDIVFLRKRSEGEARSETAWTQSQQMAVPSRRYQGDSGEDQVFVNEYFQSNPDMMLGELVFGRGTGGRGDAQLLASDDYNLPVALAQAVSRLPENIMQSVERQQTRLPVAPIIIEDPTTIKPNAYVIRDGKVWQRRGETITESGEVKPTLEVVDAPDATMERLKGTIGIRDAFRVLINQQLTNQPDAEIAQQQGVLSRLYDAFVGKYGLLHTPVNIDAFLDDPDAASLLALENYDRATKTATKSEFFTERTIPRYERPTSADSPQAALAITLSETGRVDFDRMQELVGLSPAEIQTHLQGLIYLDPAGDAWVTAEEYLSGNVREKLRQAISAYELDPGRYEGNIEALREVQPPDLPYDKITAPMGAPWVDTSYYDQFFAHLFNTDQRYFKTVYVPETASWGLQFPDTREANYIERSTENREKWGTTRKDALELIDALLNHKNIKVYNGSGDKKVFNPEATQVAQDKANEIAAEWSRWLWDDPVRQQEISDLYNTQINNLRDRQYDGSHLQLPGMNPEIFKILYPHQKSAIWHGVSAPNVLLGHAVGSGKTFEQIAIMMEKRRLGLARKNMFVVENHLVEQMARDFRQAYPLAKILVTSEKSMTLERRQEFLGRIATGDWDAVIIKKSQFGLIGMRPEAQKEFLDTQISELEEALTNALQDDPRGMGFNVKQLRNVLNRQLDRLKKVTDEASAGKDLGMTFEALGVDSLVIDESDTFKNLMFQSKLDRVSGLGSKSGNDRTADMFLKITYLHRMNNGAGVVFASGTPISNSIAEMHGMMRYLIPNTLAERGISQFDAWADTFAHVQEALEVNSTGSGYESVKSLSQFVNLPELRRLWRLVADVQTPAMLEEAGILVSGKNLPKVTRRFSAADSDTGELGAGWDVIRTEGSEELKEYVQDLILRMDRYKDPATRDEHDNPLVITTDAKKASTDMRLVRPELPYDPNGKIARLVENAWVIYDESAASQGTQMIFYDGKPPDRAERKSGNFPFNVPWETRSRLIERGIPEQEIAFIHDYDKQEQKQALFDSVNRGDIRILIGSTEKMGVGTNAQRKLIMEHQVDVPWRPRDLEQRIGRMVRPGNTQPVVHNAIYITRGSFDARLWQIIERKSKFIDQINSNDDSIRTAEDDTGRAIIRSAEEAKAAASDNPMIREQLVVQRKRDRLRNLRSDFYRQRDRARYKIGNLPKQIAAADERIANLQADMDTMEAERQKWPEKGVLVAVGDVTYTGTDEAYQALLGEYRTALELQRKKGDAVERHRLGTFLGFPVTVKIQTSKGTKTAGAQFYVEGTHELYPWNLTETAQGSLMSLRNVTTYPPRWLEKAMQDRDNFQREFSNLSGTADAPFGHERELAELEAKHQQIEQALTGKPATEEEGSDINALAYAEPAIGMDEGDVLPMQEPAARAPRLGHSSAPRQPLEPIDTVTLVPPSLRRPMLEGMSDTAPKPSAMIRDMERSFNVPIRTGRLRRRRRQSLGQYKRHSVVIRLRLSTDVEVAAHEVGHHVHRTGPFDALITAHEPELTAMAPLGYEPDEMLQEGFAEFFRYYLTNDSQAQAFAPTFYPEFDRALTHYSPEWAAAARRIRRDYTAFSDDASPEARVGAVLSVGESQQTSKGFRYWWHNFYRAMLEDIHWVKVTRDLMADGQPLTSSDDAYVLGRLIRGVNGKIGNMVRHGMVPYGDLRTRVSKGLPEILDAWGGDLAQGERSVLRRYLLARGGLEAITNEATRAAEMSQRTGQVVTPRTMVPMTQADAMRTITNLEIAYPQLLQTFAEIRAFEDGGLAYLRDAGMLSDENFTTIQEMHRNHVPLYRVMEESIPLEVSVFGGTRHVGTGAGSSKFADIGSPVHRRKGSVKDVIDPLESLIKNTYAFVSAADRNAVMQALVRQAKGAQGFGELIEPLRTPMAPTTAEIAQIRDDLEAAGISIPLGAEEAMVSIWRPNYHPQRPNAVWVWSDGAKQLYQLAPELYRSVEALDQETVGMAIRFLSAPAHLLRLGATQINPSFMIRNPVRDIQSGWINAGLAVPKGFVSLVQTMLSPERGQRLHELYNAWELGGGAQASIVSMDRASLQEDLASLLRRGHLKQKSLHALKHPVATLRYLSEMSELLTRLDVFAGSLGSGGLDTATKDDLLRAGFASREGSLDFGRHGALLAAVRHMTAFMNANVQGIDKMGRVLFTEGTAQDRTMAWLRVFAGITLPSMLLWAVNADDERYRNLPQWLKDTTWLIPVGSYFVPIPKPPLAGQFFGSSMERFLDWVTAKDPQAGQALMRALLRGLDFSWIATVAVPWIENYANRSLFFDRPIVPRGLEGVLPQEQATLATSDTARLAARLFGPLADVPLVGQLSAPAKLENLILGYTGGLGRIGLQVGDLMLHTLGMGQTKVRPAPDVPLGDVPVLSSITRTVMVPMTPTLHSPNLERFHEALETARRYETTIRSLIREGRTEDAARLLHDPSSTTIQLSMLEQAEEVLHGHRANLHQIYRSTTMTPQEKQQQRREIIGEMNNLAGEALQVTRGVTGSRPPYKRMPRGLPPVMSP